LLLALMFALQDPLAARPDTLRPKHDALHYDIVIAVSDTGAHFAGEVTTTWRLTSVEPVVLQLDTVFRVVRVLIDGRENTRLRRTMFGVENGHVVVPHEKRAGDTLQTRVRYHGYPKDGLVIRRAGDTITVFADNWPDRAHKWFPSQDHPSDKATVAFHVEAPPGHRVIANGTLLKVDTLPGGRTQWHYQLDRPVSTYNMVLGIARFAVTELPPAGCAVRCVPLSVWALPGDSANAQIPFRRAGDMIDWLQRQLGPFPYPRLAHVESSTIFGGMENATAIFYDERAMGSGRLGEATVAHETAHQWFGDAVTEADWHHLWLSEGFATFLAAEWVGHADGDSARRASYAGMRKSVMESRVTERPILDTAATDLMGLLNSNNYPKGALVLHALHGIVGDSAMWRGLRTYQARFRDGVALSSDFAAVMSEVAGRDLTWFFREWLTQPGYPQLEVTRTYDRRARRLTLTVRQVQPEGWGSWTLPQLGFALDGAVRRADVAGRSASVVFDNVDREPAAVRVDPAEQWLLTASVR
jgi:aminopeptidase N